MVINPGFICRDGVRFVVFETCNRVSHMGVAKQSLDTPTLPTDYAQVITKWRKNQILTSDGFLNVNIGYDYSAY